MKTMTMALLSSIIEEAAKMIAMASRGIDKDKQPMSDKAIMRSLRASHEAIGEILDGDVAAADRENGRAW